jgi:predicted secreted hydrolase
LASARLAALGGAGLAACGTPVEERRLRSEAPLAVPPAATPTPPRLPPVRLPHDEAPHNTLAEWWYYTGHLFGDSGSVAVSTGSPGSLGTPSSLGSTGSTGSTGSDGSTSGGPSAPGAAPSGATGVRLRTGTAQAAAGREEYGFELVFFRGVRGTRPPGYAAHFAVTDLGRGRFTYDQRQDVALNETASPAPAPAARAPGAAASSQAPDQAPDAGFQGPAAPGQGTGATIPSRPPGIVSYGSADGGFDLAFGGWWMRGRDGQDHLVATMPGYELDLELVALRPPALHLGEPPWQPGLISFGPAGYSYYYSRTRLAVRGTLVVDGAPRTVGGEAWMDHQWGDFLVLGGGGWDWFSAHLHDGRDLTLSVVRDASGATVLAYGTLVAPGGEAHHLPPSAFELTVTQSWTSPHTGIRYPAGWRLRVPDQGLDLQWTPLLADQELDTRASTGVIYWEGAVAVSDAATGHLLGRGYVELTGYTAPR